MPSSSEVLGTTTISPRPRAHAPARASPPRYTPQGGRVAQLCFAAPSPYYATEKRVVPHEAHETEVAGGKHP